MKFLTSYISLKYLLSGFLFISFYGCDTSEPNLNPDYTGQIGQLSDIQGNVYKTIGLGSQIWMAENLKTTLFNDSSQIPVITNDSVWAKLQSSGCCWYNNDSILYNNIYGSLYNFYAVNSRLLCPTGWHVPDDSDWKTLESFLGGSDIAGGKLKDYYKPYWKEPNPCFENNYGFYALPGGERLNYTGGFFQIGESGFWWTKTEKDIFDAYSRSMSCQDKSLRTYEISKKRGCSVRCIKDL
jgi:uncharacterized protein (TIGR02145 family)